MQPPPPPHDEVERLAALRALKALDTPAEERFDRITRLACTLLEVPIALISLVDENRQWFKSKQGLTACETGRDISFCGHAIHEEEYLWVEDALQDERFHDNPLVVGEPFIRFYAGCTLRSKGGERLGTLCVIDKQPRSLTEESVEMLRDLCRLTETELETPTRDPSQAPVLHPQTGEERKEMLDALTGSWSADGIDAVLRHGLGLLAEKQRPATIIVGEVDEQQELEDTWARAGYEIALAEVAQALRMSVRAYDSIGRISDCQFLVFMLGCPGARAPERIDCLRNEIAENVVLQSLPVTMSFGYATWEPGDGEPDPKALIRAAHESLAASRTSGDLTSTH